MSLFSRLSSSRRNLEEKAYERVAEEIANGIKSEGLWLKAMSKADFDHARAKSIYVNLRVESILSEIINNKIKENRNEKSSNSPISDRNLQKEIPTLEYKKAKFLSLGGKKILKAGILLLAAYTIHSILMFLFLGRPPFSNLLLSIVYDIAYLLTEGNVTFYLIFFITYGITFYVLYLALISLRRNSEDVTGTKVIRKDI